MLALLKRCHPRVGGDPCYSASSIVAIKSFRLYMMDCFLAALLVMTNKAWIPDQVRDDTEDAGMIPHKGANKWQ